MSLAQLLFGFKSVTQFINFSFSTRLRGRTLWTISWYKASSITVCWGPVSLGFGFDSIFLLWLAAKVPFWKEVPWELLLKFLLYAHDQGCVAYLLYFLQQYKTMIWTASSEFGTYRLCEQRRFRRACASAQSRQNLRCSLIQAVSQEEPSDRKPDP